jgi:dihydropyrimidinase
MINAVVGGTVVTPGGPREADVAIEGGLIAAITPRGGRAGSARGGRAGSGRAGTALDATGCWVLPGGVDPHTHAMASVRDATLAAAAGGTTTVLSFSGPEPGENDVACLLRRRGEIAASGAVVDVGLHAAIGSPERVTPDDLAEIRRAGAAAIKVYLAYPEYGIMCSSAGLLRLMRAARHHGLVTCVHCENGPLIEELLTVALAAGPPSPRVFASTRPPEVEEEAVARTLAIASLAGAPCYLVHMSTGLALGQIRLARSRGVPRVHAETCPHYLLLTESRYEGPGAEGFLVAPPLRGASHVEALWEGLADGTVDTVGSDHCQVRSPTLGPLADAGGHYEFGLPGIGERLPLLLSEGLARGLPITRLVRLACENPARAFGHYPRKGALAAGSDADVVLFDPGGETVLAAGQHASTYAGRRLRGSIRAVLARGTLVAASGSATSGATGDGRGRYLPAGDPLPTAPAGSEPPRSR